MRYLIHVEHNTGKAASLEEALGIMSGWMRIDPEQVRAEVEESGIGRAVNGFATGQISDLEWQAPSPADPEEAARNKVRELYGEDGVLEVDDDPVSRGDDGWVVQVWVWVSDSDAGIGEEEEPTDDLLDRYVAAVEHPVAEFDGNSVASMGCDSGAYVSGWICIGIEDDECQAA